MKELSKKILNVVFPVLLLAVVGGIAYSNYAVGTTLSGWDTLHPEFNFPLYLKRIFFGVWQEHQGVGAVATQSQAGEFGHLLITWLLSLSVPRNMIRYVFFVLTLLVGTLGMYFFILKRVLNAKNELSFKLASFIASLFYLLNLATIQQYYVPLEMFAIHFATLPWLFLIIINYLRNGKRTSLIWFFFISFFAASSSHTPTLFYVYLALLVAFLIFWQFLNFNLRSLKRILIVLGLTFVFNAFWMAPNVYYLYRHPDDVRISKIHSDFTPEAFFQSKSFGTFNDMINLKNFLFNWRQYDFEKGSYEDLMEIWSVNLSKSGVKQLNYLFLGLGIFGFLMAILKRNKAVISLFPVLVVCIFFLINSNFPFGNLFDYLREKSVLFKEGFRFPFTKFSLFYVFCLASSVGLGLSFILKKLRYGMVRILIGTILVIGIVYSQLPAFTGNFFDPEMRVKIPNEYNEAFKWFSKKDHNLRIAKLPLNTFWGWSFLNWGYQGAGFSWFGLSQPIFEREFDRWSQHNETFYNEASYALYNKDAVSFDKILKKYGVKYLFLDESIINAGGTESLLFIPQIKEIMANTGDINEVYKSGFLSVYETNNDKSTGVSTPDSYVSVNADFGYSKEDVVYKKYGDYVFNKESSGYPFSNFDNRKDVSFYLTDSFGGENLVIENKRENAKVTLPVDEKISEDFSKKRGFEEGYNCDIKKVGEVKKEFEDSYVYYEADNGGVSCDYFYYPELERDKSYLLRIKGESLQGRSLKIYLQNLETGRMDIEELLPTGKFDSYFVVYPTLNENKENPGYTLNLETRSFGRIKSENKIEKIEFIPLDLEFLRSIYTKNQEPERTVNNLNIAWEKKLSPTNYLVETSGNGLLVLNQGYEDGWVAYLTSGNKLTSFFPFLFSKPIEHTKVNSWANGWMVPEGTNTISIIFWPQYLEWGGMALGFTAFLLIVLFPVDSKKRRP